MNKKILLISGGLLTLIIVIVTIFIVSKNNTNNETIMQANKNFINNSFLTLMLEQEDGSYLESTSNTWPGDGYIFNSELSACENGGELDFDSETNKVILYSNKSDGCYIYFDIYNKPIINSINLSEVTNNSITINVTTTEGTNPISNYYYIINDGTPISTTNNTYTFSGLDSNTTYTIKVYVVDTLGYSSEISNLNVETEEPILLADWVINEYNGIQGNNGIYYHTDTLANSAGDNSYRYAGANPNNYVCFGSDAEVCSSDNLYRIIGVFDDEVKLIKNTSIGNYYWTGSSDIWSNTWSSSTLNSDILNKTFLNGFVDKWNSLITIHSWKIEGVDYNFVQYEKLKIFFDNEVGVNSCNSTVSSCVWQAKIGLMYASDYGYATISDHWGYSLYGYYNPGPLQNNWMYTGIDEWTITRISDLRSVFSVSTNGSIGGGEPYYYMKAIRPCFYLNSNVAYIAGDGSQQNPIRIA